MHQHLHTIRDQEEGEDINTCIQQEIRRWRHQHLYTTRDQQEGEDINTCIQQEIRRKVKTSTLVYNKRSGGRWRHQHLYTTRDQEEGEIETLTDIYSNKTRKRLFSQNLDVDNVYLLGQLLWIFWQHHHPLTTYSTLFVIDCLTLFTCSQISINSFLIANQYGWLSAMPYRLWKHANV